MTSLRIFGLAAFLSATSAIPALAAPWERIGTISVDYNLDRDRVSPDFGGPVESLRFTARGGDVQCRYIRATFGNGTTRDIFSGRLRQGMAQNVDLPGEARNIARLDLMCHAFQRSGGQIEVQADIGQYQNAWRNGPRWSYWSRYFTDWNRMIDNATSYWVRLGTMTFTPRYPRDNAFGGFAGRSITQLAFRPVDGSAICSDASIRFGNGSLAKIPVNGGRPLMEGQTYRIDLPGNQRNVTNVVLRCYALGQRSVTISVLGNK